MEYMLDLYNDRNPYGACAQFIVGKAGELKSELFQTEQKTVI